jgi:hypothetical protein
MYIGDTEVKSIIALWHGQSEIAAHPMDTS